VVELICPQCGSTFFRDPHYLKLYKTLTCSSKCGGLIRRKGHKNKKGYILSFAGAIHTKEHRRIMSEVLGRPLLATEDVHHINGNKSDNRPDNLEVIDHREHGLQHNPTKWNIETAVKLLSEGMSQTKVAARVGVSRQCMMQSLRRRGLVPQKQTKTPAAPLPSLVLGLGGRARGHRESHTS